MHSQDFMYEMSPSVHTPLTSLTVQAGGVAEFTCRICGRPRPSITWKFNNNIPVRPDSRTVMSYREDGVVTLQVSSDPFSFLCAEPHSAVSWVADLRTGSRWFHPWLGQYPFRGSMIVIATRFIPLSPLSVFSTMVMRESSHRLGNNILRSTGLKKSMKAWIGALAAAI